MCYNIETKGGLVMEKENFSDVNAQIAMLKLTQSIMNAHRKHDNENMINYYRKLQARIYNGEPAAIDEALKIHTKKLRR